MQVGALGLRTGLQSRGLPTPLLTRLTLRDKEGLPTTLHNGHEPKAGRVIHSVKLTLGGRGGYALASARSTHWDYLRTMSVAKDLQTPHHQKIAVFLQERFSVVLGK